MPRHRGLGRRTLARGPFLSHERPGVRGRQGGRPVGREQRQRTASPAARRVLPDEPRARRSLPAVVVRPGRTRGRLCGLQPGTHPPATRPRKRHHRLRRPAGGPGRGVLRGLALAAIQEHRLALQGHPQAPAHGVLRLGLSATRPPEPRLQTGRPRGRTRVRGTRSLSDALQHDRGLPAGHQRRRASRTAPQVLLLQGQ